MLAFDFLERGERFGPAPLVHEVRAVIVELRDGLVLVLHGLTRAVAAASGQARRQRGYHAQSRYLHVISVAKGG